MSDRNEINLNEFNCISANRKDTFQKMSYDKKNKVHLIQSTNLAFNFDDIHHDFARSKKFETTSTSDSIYYDDNYFYFIEFKNVPSNKPSIREDIIKKLIYSYLNFNDLLINESILKYNYESFNIERKFIFVYSKEKTISYDNKQLERVKRYDQKIGNVQHRNRYKVKKIEEEMKKYIKPYVDKIYKEILFVDNISFEKNYAPNYNKLNKPNKSNNY
ncbi:hypothetical protein K4O90_08890 [Staphylococcus epidermidis]|nr:hypothetical protein [Staphylococcus epidermidis]